MSFSRKFDAEYYRAHPLINHTDYLQYFQEAKAPEISWKIACQTVPNIDLSKHQVDKEAKEEIFSAIGNFHKAGAEAQALSNLAQDIVKAHRTFPDNKVTLDSKTRGQNDKLVRQYSGRVDDFYKVIADHVAAAIKPKQQPGK